MNLFDEKEAVAFIKSKVDCQSLSDDDILDIVDAIYDYYDENDELELDFDDDEDDVDTDAGVIAAYVVEHFDGLDAELIKKIVEAEIDYEDSLL